MAHGFLVCSETIAGSRRIAILLLVSDPVNISRLLFLFVFVCVWGRRRTTLMGTHPVQHPGFSGFYFFWQVNDWRNDRQACRRRCRNINDRAARALCRRPFSPPQTYMFWSRVLPVLVFCDIAKSLKRTGKSFAALFSKLPSSE